MARAEPALRVEVVYGAGPRAVWSWQGELPSGATLADALRASGLLEVHPEIDLGGPWSAGIWGRRCEASQALRDRDRVEVWRALKVDPKEARRLRYKQHLARYGAKDASGSRKR